MSRAHRGAVIALTLLLATGCIKSMTFNPYAPPDTDQLDRRQAQVNASTDLEPTRAAVSQLETQIRAAIAKYSPQTMLAPYGIDEALGGCQDPYTWAVGQQYTPARLSGRTAPDLIQWQQITDELKPAFEKAGFQPGKEPIVNGISYANGSAFVILTNGGSGSPLMYEASTGCRLPTAWRTAAPPPGTYPPDPEFHYPYLFGGDGGRTVKPGG